MSRRFQKMLALSLIFVLASTLVAALVCAFSSFAHVAQGAPIRPMRTLPYYLPQGLAQSF